MSRDSIVGPRVDYSRLHLISQEFFAEGCMGPGGVLDLGAGY